MKQIHKNITIRSMWVMWVTLGDPCASIATQAPQVEGVAALSYAGNPVMLQYFCVHTVANLAASIHPIEVFIETKKKLSDCWID